MYAFDYPPDGRLSSGTRRLLWTTPSAWAGGPDGACTDAEGFVWVAVNGAGKVSIVSIVV